MLGLFSTSSVALGLILVVLYILIRCGLNYRKLSHVPGPFLAHIGPLWLFYRGLRGDLYRVLPALYQKHGSVIRIAPDYVVVNDVDVIKQVYATRSPFIRGRWYDAMRLGAERDSVLTLKDDKEHAMHRSKLIPGYSGREVPGFESDLDKFIVQIVQVIGDEYVDKNLTFDFAQLAGFMTLDILTKIAFNLEVGYLRDNKDHFDYLKSMAEFTPIMNLCCNHPTIFNILNSRVVMSFLKPLPEDTTGSGALIGLARKHVRESFRNDEDDGSQTMIASWKRHGVTEAQCEDETMNAIVAGSDSTSTALRTTVLHIITSPRVYATLNQEIDNALDQGRVSFPVVKLSEATALPYLSAVVKEGLRVFAPLHGLASHYSLEPFVIEGRTIPPGTQIGADWYGIPRNKKYFGADAEEFRPERWTEADEETYKVYERAMDMTFATGTKAPCLGQNLALMELHKCIFELFRHFDFAVVNPLYPMTTSSNSLVSQKDLWVRASRKRG